uniref:Uncharacterized protein n=1 Tax=viral metagenome TaxID=1070528 RepID=A0A6H1ZX46_9ZZZZ
MSERRRASGYLHDERGSKSAGRLWLSIYLTFLAVLIPVDAISVTFDVPDPAWALLGVVFGGLLAWVAGPRMTQHLGEIGAGIAQAKRSVPFSSVAATFEKHEWARGSPDEGVL